MAPKAKRTRQETVQQRLGEACSKTQFLLTSEGNYLLLGVHNSRVSSNGSSHDIVGIREVDNDDLSLLVDFFLNTDEMVGLEC